MEGVEETRRIGQSEPEHGEEARLDIALAHEKVPDPAGVGDEGLGLGAFLCRALHDLHAVQGLGEMRVHGPEGVAHLVGDRRQLPQVLPKGNEVCEGKHRRCEKQRRVVAGHHKKGDDHEQRGADDEIQARAEHQVDLAHIIGGARHGIAHGLEIMEGHALAEERHVHLVANIAFHPLCDELGPEVASKLEGAAHDL
jgi:hypothetical protein